jgi:serine/threonine protein kinase
MLRVPYSIGYTDVGFAGQLTDFLSQVEFGDPALPDSFVVASDETLRTTMDGLAGDLNPETLELNLARADAPVGGFPISGYAYWYLKRNHTEFSSCYQAWLVCKFLEWAYTDPQAASIASANGWVVPPESVVQIALDRLQDVQCNNTETNPPTIISALQYTPPKYRTITMAEKVETYILIIVPVACGIVLAVMILYFFERRRKTGDHVWVIKAEDLKFKSPPEMVGRGRFGLVLLAEYRGTQVAVKRVIAPRTGKTKVKSSSTSRMTSIDSSFFDVKMEEFTSNPEQASNDIESNEDPIFGKNDSMGNRGSLVPDSSGKTTSEKTYQSLKKMFIEEMRVLSKLRHPCITTIMGAVIESTDTPMLVLEYMDHGSLYDILHNETMVLDGDVVLPILRDISQGIRFLHSAVPQVIHGDLKAHNILVDSKFRAKIADFGLALRTKGQTGTIPWMAPELLDGKGANNSSASDIYSFGIILYEVHARKEPYEGESIRRVIQEVIDLNINRRPPVPLGMPPQVQTLMQDCLVADPQQRPEAEELDHRLKRINADTLDSGAAPKALKARSANVSLFDIFPRHVAEALRDGRKIEPEHKECVTIFFSDIVGFTQLSSQLDPRKVASLLDRLYHKFDDLAGKHEIYKVETIGDAYMAVTNLVNDQYSDHAKRIAMFAIEALKAANETIIDPDDESKGFVNIRVGFHCGPVVASVVGNRNPRYCLFGDTVNTASRMETNSSKNRILCSKAAYDIVREQMPDLSIKPRGAIKVKGKGNMVTYWVNEEHDLEVPVANDGGHQIDMAVDVVSGGKIPSGEGPLARLRQSMSKSSRRFRKRPPVDSSSVEGSSQGDFSSYRSRWSSEFLEASERRSARVIFHANAAKIETAN